MSKRYQKSAQKSTRKSQKSKDVTHKQKALAKKKRNKLLKKKQKAAKKKNDQGNVTSPKRTPEPTEPLFSQGDIPINNADDLKSILNDSLHSYAIELGIEIANALLEDDVSKLCGARSERVLNRTAYRHGSQAGFVVMAGQKIAIQKPRVRSLEKNEIDLQTYQQMQNEAAMPEAAFTKMVRGVSCRDYEDVVDAARAGFGIKKSSVSKNFVKASVKQLAEFAGRRFDETLFTVVMIDGVAFGGAVMICALGIDAEGNKHVLGVCQGETENAEVVTALLTNLRERGVSTSQPTLFCIDGAKALAAGIKRVFGRHAVIQRCQIHKKRNVEKHLAQKHHAELKRRMNAAYESDDFEAAKQQLHETVRWLEEINPDAARSLEEGLEETLTVIRLGVTGELRQRLDNTNTIESMFSRVRDVTRRVKRWRDGDMRHRWCVAGLLRAEAGFHRVRGYRVLPALQQSLTAFLLDNETETLWNENVK